VGSSQLSLCMSAPCTAAVPPELTPWQRHHGTWVKRDDLYAVAGVCGGKARTCWQLAQGATGLVTAGSRASPQVNIVAHVAAALGLPCRVHTPTGKASAEVAVAVSVGATRIAHRAGYNSVIVARAREDAAARGWQLIPFGMECSEAVAATAAQVAQVPGDIGRLVVPVGSGMSLAGILWGLHTGAAAGHHHLPVLGVVVGAAPERRLDRWAPPEWRRHVTLARSPHDYHQAAPATRLGSLVLDAHYEAKALPHLAPDDALWVVGIRRTAAVAAV